ncbi:MAG: transposase [Methanobrevibacter sp.]|jgi:putative transposase|nr:transposase [Candidatus Methanovirga basalitermitum]
MYLKEIKKIYSFLQGMDTISAQKAYEGLIAGFQNIHKSGAGYVKWKSKKESIQTFKTSNIKIVEGRLKIPKLKSLIKMKYSCKVDGKILTATIFKENNKYYVSINVSKSIIINKPETGENVGIDLGLKDSMTLSDGFKSGKVLDTKSDKKIARLNKELAIRTNNFSNWSKNSKKTRTKLSKAYNDKKNKILDSIHKITTKIVSKYDKIFVGNVN